jgi:hypothetical protein
VVRAGQFQAERHPALLGVEHGGHRAEGLGERGVRAAVEQAVRLQVARHRHGAHDPLRVVLDDLDAHLRRQNLVGELWSDASQVLREIGRHAVSSLVLSRTVGASP